MKRETPKANLEGEGYVIRFAHTEGDPRNLPLAITAASWRAREQRAARYGYHAADADRWLPVTTTTGQRLEIRRADCGAGCRCALEWRPA